MVPYPYPNPILILILILILIPILMVIISISHPTFSFFQGTRFFLLTVYSFLPSFLPSKEWFFSSFFLFSDFGRGGEGGVFSCLSLSVSPFSNPPFLPPSPLWAGKVGLVLGVRVGGGEIGI